jgi:hypothetical protein
MSTSPFLFIADSKYQSLYWAFITAPIVTRSHHYELAELSRMGFRFAGMPSYLTFPRADSRDSRDYSTLCEFWCHCFREPERYLPAGIPRAPISYSDFTNPMQLSLAKLGVQIQNSIAYDFIYVSPSEPWQEIAKNSSLALRCIPRLCQELNLKALVIGKPSDNFFHTKNIEFSPFLEWRDFLVRLAACRFLFAPNLIDPSPRILAEALCLDVPLVVNHNILGGWKYVNAFTGEFFEDETDVVSAVKRCLTKPKSARRWFSANYGPYLAGKRLLRLLRSVDPETPEFSHVTITTSIGQLAAPKV